MSAVASSRVSPSLARCLVQLKVECKPWKIQLPSRVLELEFTTISSSFHVEMNPSDVGNNDRWVAQGGKENVAGGRRKWVGFVGQAGR